jgi:hypothetical protein
MRLFQAALINLQNSYDMDKFIESAFDNLEPDDEEMVMRSLGAIESAVHLKPLTNGETYLIY